MSNIESKSAENVFKDIYSISLSENHNEIGHKKYIKLKQLTTNDKSNTFILADIRAYMNGRPTKCGVCLTPYEFDWLANKLLLNPMTEQTLSGKESTRILTIKPKPKNIGVVILQQVNDQLKRINLYKREMKKIVENYGSFYSIIEEMEELEEENEANGVDECDH